MPPAVSRRPATLSLRQQLTRVSGSARLDGRDVPLEEVKLRGDRLTFRLAGRKGEFSGQVKGNTIEGTFDGKTQSEESTVRIGAQWTPVTIDYTPPKCVAGGLHAVFTVPEGETALLDCVEFRPKL